MSTIEARWTGTCPECGGRWQPGDLIRSMPVSIGKDAAWTWKHDVCPDDPGPTDLRKGESVCETCWLVHPAGACDR